MKGTVEKMYNMENLKQVPMFGQIVLSGREKKRIGFIKVNQTWNIGYDLDEQKLIKFRGSFVLTDEFSDVAVKKWNEYNNRQMVNNFDGMKKGQAFMFQGDKYYLIRTKSKKALIEDTNGITYNLQMTATIKALDETKPLCKYCGEHIVDYEDLLCSACREVFGHALYSEL